MTKTWAATRCSQQQADLKGKGNGSGTSRYGLRIDREKANHSYTEYLLSDILVVFVLLLLK